MHAQIATDEDCTKYFMGRICKFENGKVVMTLHQKVYAIAVQLEASDAIAFFADRQSLLNELFQTKGANPSSDEIGKANREFRRMIARYLQPRSSVFIEITGVIREGLQAFGLLTFLNLSNDFTIVICLVVWQRSQAEAKQALDQLNKYLQWIE